MVRVSIYYTVKQLLDTIDTHHYYNWYIPH